MDPAAEFLHRHERKAIQKHIRGEPMLAASPARLGEQNGLLAATKSRLVFASKKVRTSVQAIGRDKIVAMSEEKRRYGILHVRTRDGAFHFEMMARQGATRILDAWRPPRKPVDPIKAAIPRRPRQRRPAAAPGTTPGFTPRPQRQAKPTQPAPDPLAHRGGPAHRQKLMDMHRRGLITKAEMEWQLGK